MFIEVFNFVEAVFWMGLGVWVAVYYVRRNTGSKVVKVLATTLVLFGVSDIVEVYSGAWWRPWWLLAWKVCCLLLITWGVIYLLRKGGKI